MYVLYKVTNIVNGKYYIGVHKTNDPNDSYLGSGIAIVRAVKRHGKQRFTKETLEIFETEAAAYTREKEVVSQDVVNDLQSYNCTVGGFGGFSHITPLRGDAHPMRCDLEYKNKVLQQRRSYIENNKEKVAATAILNLRKAVVVNTGKHRSTETKAKISAGNKGKAISEEHKEAVRRAQLGKVESLETRHRKSESHKQLAKSKDMGALARGSKRSDAFKAAVSKRLKGKKHKIIVCPHCGVEGGVNNLKRWHFDSCKYKH